MYDVTDLIQSGENAFGVMLGNGWYGQGLSGPKSLLFQLNLDGKPFLWSSTSSWKGIQGPITMDSIYNGENYDARYEIFDMLRIFFSFFRRMETPGWTNPGFDDSSWSNAQSITGPPGILSVQMIPPIQVQATLVPKAITQPQSGVYVYDFEQSTKFLVDS